MAALLLAAWNVAAAAAPEAEPTVLARVEVAGPLAACPLPAYAHLQDAQGAEYLLVVAELEDLDRAGWPFRVLDAGAGPAAYVLAAPRRAGAREAAAGRFTVVHDDGRNWVVRAPNDAAEGLPELGFAVRRLEARPLTWGPPPRAAARVSAAASAAAAPDALVRNMLAGLSTNRLHALMRRLTGAEAAVAGGDYAAIATRHTASVRPIERATQFAYDRLQSLGLETRFEPWSRGSYSGRNVVATRAGTSRASEILVVVAHLDNQPGGSLAPGADDNASGTAVVITAAELLRPYRFERTIRFLLVTGEEQGLYGSAAHAAASASAGDDIVAVFNMDMIAWDGNDDGALGVHIRRVSDPSSPADREVAAVFTNAVAAYGLSGVLRPAIIADSEAYSDHASFWNRGYPGILAIEDYADFTPHYHTTGDTLATLNWGYFCRFAVAALATVAHLAGPAGFDPFDAVEVAALPADPGSGIGAGVWFERHEEGAAEGGPEGRDTAWSAVAPNPNTRWLRVESAPDGVALAGDARPTASATMFRTTLRVIDSAGAGVSGPTRLRFDLPAPPDATRIYLARVHVDGDCTASGTGFDWVGDLRAVVERGGYVDLPVLRPLADGTAYGTCDVAVPFVDRTAAGAALGALDVRPGQIVIRTRAQPGTSVRDEVQTAAALQPPVAWTRLAVLTNAVPPDLAAFDSGWTELTTPVAAIAPTNGPAAFFRIRRTWLAPP